MTVSMRSHHEASSAAQAGYAMLLWTGGDVSEEFW